MEKAVQVQAYQKLTSADVADLAAYPGESLDHVVHDLGIPDQAYWGFPTAKATPFVANVGNGRLFWNGEVYFNDLEGGEDIDVSTLVPLVTKRIIAIVAYGIEEDANDQPRTFLTDAASRATQARVVSTERWRWANLAPIAGQENPQPSKPVIPSNVLAVAYLTIDQTGILSIEMDQDNLAPSVRSNDQRLNENDLFRATIGSVIATLRSDLSNIANMVKGSARQDMVIQIAQDVARLKSKSGLPSTYTSFGSDHFLDTSLSDTGNADFLCKVEEGIRFADAQVEIDQVGLANSIDPNASVSSNFVLPAWTPATRVTSVSFDAELSLTQYAYQTFQSVELFQTRTRIQYGPGKIVCSNSSWYQSGHYDRNGVFERNGENFIVQDLGYSYASDGSDEHEALRVTKYWYDTYTVPYWSTVTTNQTANGAVITETFLNTQPGYLVQLGLYFSRIGNAGTVTVMLCQCDASAEPDPSQVIASSVLQVSDLKPSKTRTPVNFNPTLLTAGSRYGIICVTTGAHFLWCSTGNKFTSGTLFTNTDGAYSVGDLTKDICFDLVYAEFISPYVELALVPLQLANGIADIDLNFDSSIPDGTSIVYSYLQNGDWNDIVPGGQQIVGQPAILQWKAKLAGTTALMPGFGVGPRSQVKTSRARADGKWISVILHPATAVHTVQLTFRLEAWRGAPHHTFALKLRTGAGYGTQTAPSVITFTAAPDDPTAEIVNATFTFGSTITSYQIEADINTDNVVTLFHGAEAIWVDIA